MTELELNDSVSPFDKIRHEDADGEYWLARELMPLLGYKASSSWQDFSNVVERARQDMINLDQDPDRHAPKIMSVSSSPDDRVTLQPRTVADYRLSRYGCFMVAMNGDYKKSEVSAARAYFAVNTRKWEVYQELSDRERALMLARQVIELDEQLTEKMQELAVAMPKVEEWEEFINVEGLLNWMDLAGLLYRDDTKMGRNRLIAKLRELNVIKPAWQAGNAQPYQEYKNLGWFEIKKLPHNRKPQTLTTHFGASEIYKLLKDNGENVTDPFKQG